MRAGLLFISSEMLNNSNCCRNYTYADDVVCKTNPMHLKCSMKTWLMRHSYDNFGICFVWRKYFNCCLFTVPSVCSPFPFCEQEKRTHTHCFKRSKSPKYRRFIVWIVHIKANLFILMSTHEQIRFSTTWSLFLSIIYAHLLCVNVCVCVRVNVSLWDNHIVYWLYSTVSNTSHCQPYNYAHLWSRKTGTIARTSFRFQIIVITLHSIKCWLHRVEWPAPAVNTEHGFDLYCVALKSAHHFCYCHINNPFTLFGIYFKRFAAAFWTFAYAQTITLYQFVVFKLMETRRKLKWKHAPYDFINN